MRSACAAVAVFGSVLGSASVGADTPIGVALPLTGPYAWVGENMRRGAMKPIRKSGGLFTASAACACR